MLGAIFGAADEQVRAAGALLAGGHTIRDAEPKYGLAVIGTVHPDGIWTKSNAQPGDAVYVTKPLGTGLIMTGHKRGEIGTQQLERAVGWMKTLNAGAADVLRKFRVNAVTDVTGFGLFGHAYETADRSGVRIVLESERFPAIDGALDLARKGVRTSGDPRNRDFAGRHLTLKGARDAGRARLRPPDGWRAPRLPARRPGRHPRGRVRRAQALLAARRRCRGGQRRLRRRLIRPDRIVRQGMIHGRFQPFHKGHLEYMRGAAECCDELFVGITNPTRCA